MTFEKRYDHAMDSPNSPLDNLARLELAREVSRAIKFDVDLNRVWELLERDEIPFSIDNVDEYLAKRFPREEGP